jgi:hypothetical protein
MDMSMNSSDPNSMMSISMAFYTSTMTPLYSTSWAPTTTASYAGTCIFLILLATLFRGLLALKIWKETAWHEAEFNRRYIIVAGQPSKVERITTQDSDSKRVYVTENGVEEEVMVVKKKKSSFKPWRLTVDPLRAVMDTVIMGVAYLL